MKKEKANSRKSSSRMIPREVGAFEAKTHLSELLEEVANGQVFTITKRGKPVAELRPIPTQDAESGPRRKAGFWKGRNVVVKPDFDAPLPEFHEYMQ